MKILNRFPSLLAFLSILLFLMPAQAQEAGDGRGVVQLAAENPLSVLYLYPPNCTSDVCWMLQSLLYPRLFDIDPATGALLTASESNRAMVEAIVSDLPASQVTLRLQKDRLWNDGQPVNAYDVLFSMMVMTYHSQTTASPTTSVIGVHVIDEYTVGFRFTLTDEEIAQLPPVEQPPSPTCDVLPRANIFLLPSHAVAPAFRSFVDENTPLMEAPSVIDWLDAYEEAQLPFNFSMPTDIPTSGIHRFDGFDSENSAHFIPSDGSGVAIENVSTALSPLNAFIAGDTNLFLDVPISQRATLRTLTDPNTRNFQIAELPGRTALVVVLNFADPDRPLPAFHPETGDPIEQGQHPIFSDLRVRRALQLAIDPNPLIDGILQDSATSIGGLLPPASWGFDSSLAPLQTNIDEAKQLLDDAGWRQRGEIRRCIGCSTASENTPLDFTLMASSDYEIAEALAAQWREIGVSVFAVQGDVNAVTGQTFDAYLLPVGNNFYEAADPDRSLMLTPAGDILQPTGDFRSPVMNYGSYNNPEVTVLVEQARDLPGCAPTQRAELYHKLERLLQSDLPFLSIASPNEFYVAAPNVLGFAPRPGDALWNIDSWVVSP